MHIALFSDSYYPYISGVVRSLEIFTKELQALGHRVTLFAPAYAGTANQPGIFRFPALRAPTRHRFNLAVPWAPALERAFCDMKPDVVHVHSPFILGRVGAAWARQGSIPLVFTWHTRYDLYARYLPLGKVTARLAQNYTLAFANRCDMVVAPTGQVRSLLQEQGLRVPVKVIPTGVQEEEQQGVEAGWLRQVLGVAPTNPIILSVARLGREKNLSMLLEAFSLILKQVPQAHLVLVGVGPEDKFMRQRARILGLGDNFTLVAQPLARRELAAYYAGADLFLYASTSETQGLIIGEAQAAGKAVVAVGQGGVQEVVTSGQDGLLTDNQAEELARAALLLLFDPELREEMGSNGRKKARRFSGRAMAARLAGAYLELIGN